MNVLRKSTGEKVFEIFNYILLIVFSFICIFPFVNTLANAFSADDAIAVGKVTLFPVGWQLESMRKVISDQSIIRSFGVTITITVVGTIVNMLFTIITAYPLSRKDLRGRGIIIKLIVFTMLFQGGMIPTFLVVKGMGLLNSIWALIIPGVINVFNLMVLKTFFQNVPWELQEAAKMDGCNNARILGQIIVPLSLPAIATLSLFYMVAHWNEYFQAMLYIDKQDLYTLQIRIRQLLLAQNMPKDAGDEMLSAKLNPESLKAATIIFSMVPILMVYPWLQKYFVKGVMLGSVKG